MRRIAVRRVAGGNIVAATGGVIRRIGTVTHDEIGGRLGPAIKREPAGESDGMGFSGGFDYFFAMRIFLVCEISGLLINDGKRGKCSLRRDGGG